MLLSGGLDSATCASLAVRDHDETLFLTFDYGQRHRRELSSARAIADYFSSELIQVKFDSRIWGGSALTSDADLPEGRHAGSSSIPSTYVPARNTIFLSFALAVAEARSCDTIFVGVNAVDYSGYPDCRPEYVAAFRRLAALATRDGVEGRPVTIATPLINLTKGQIVQLALDIRAPLAMTWSCYAGGVRPCDNCESCALRQKGFNEAGVSDPARAN